MGDVSMEAFTLLDEWPVEHVAAAIVGRDGTVYRHGDTGRRFPLASISKLLLGRATLVAIEEGIVSLDEPLDTIGDLDLSWCTMRHLLAHAAGFGFDTTTRLAAPGTRRIYSNVGIELAGQVLEQRAALPLLTYLSEAVLEPLGMHSTTLDGSVATSITSTVDDLVDFIGDLRSPTLVTAETDLAFRTVQFPGLAGVVPGIGRFDDCGWGLTAEVRGAKTPHWTGTRNSAATFGHFGGAGTLLWVDPVAQIACVVLTDRTFGEWALRLWPLFADAVLDESAGIGR